MIPMHSRYLVAIRDRVSQELLTVYEMLSVTIRDARHMAHRLYCLEHGRARYTVTAAAYRPEHLPEVEPVL